VCRKRIDLLFLAFVVLLVTVISFPENVLAQGSFPSRPITLIIDQGVGGMGDVIARVVSKIAEKTVGQPIMCENKPGGGQTLAYNTIIKSKPDGYTIGVSGTSTNILQPHMQDLPFNVLTDHTDIAVYLKYAHALCVKTDSPWKTIEDIISYAKMNPGKFTYGTAGIGLSQHIIMERIAKKEGVKLSVVPFKSGNEPVLACLGGHVNAVAAGPADLIPHIQAGKLRLVLSLTETRWKIAPNIPNSFEKYGFSSLSLKAIIGPKGMPEQVVAKIENAYKKAVDDQSYIELCETVQADRYYMSGKDYSKLWRSEYEPMGKVIRDIDLGK
jgi:tripartite-type tricarboxylate transporter receptor subunit TctC